MSRATRVAVAAFGYHEVTDSPTDSGFQRPGARPYKHTRLAFAQHLAQIAQAPVEPTRVTDLALDEPGRALFLTFDDGGKSNVYIGDELARRGWHGHFFIVTQRIGSRTFLHESDIRYLRSCGHVVGSHSHTHPDIFRDLSPSQMIEEWIVSAGRLTQVLGEACTVASVPGGHISPKVLQAADAAGLRSLFTCDPTLVPRRVGNCHVFGRFLVKVHTPLLRLNELSRFQGWTRAMLLRRAKDLASLAIPQLYREYVARSTREWRHAEDVAAD